MFLIKKYTINFGRSPAPETNVHMKVEAAGAAGPAHHRKVQTSLRAQVEDCILSPEFTLVHLGQVRLIDFLLFSLFLNPFPRFAPKHREEERPPIVGRLAFVN